MGEVGVKGDSGRREEDARGVGTVPLEEGD